MKIVDKFWSYLCSYCKRNLFSDGEKRYLLATCGNDSLVKFWQLQVVNELTVKVNDNGCLSGHGGNVSCVRFSPGLSEVIASTATDKTCRVWDVVSCSLVELLIFNFSNYIKP